MELEKTLGLMLGIACGDAVGAPCEMKDSLFCQNFIKNNLEKKDFEGVFRTFEGSFSFGQYTDDTELSICLLDSFIESKGSFCVENCARHICEKINTGQVVGTGSSIKEAVSKMNKGVPWHKAGVPGPRAGNGSAMRAAPLALLNFAVEDLIEAAIKQSQITHRDPRSICGSVAVALSAYYALKGFKSSQDLNQKLINHLSPRFPDNAIVKGLSLELFQLEKEEALAIISSYDSSNTKWPGISPFVVPTVLWSLYSFLRTPGSYRETIYTAIWPGGDVDTTAAIAGGISGAFVGQKNIPVEWISHLHSHEDTEKGQDYIRSKVLSFSNLN